jgi:hypothetical protein
MSDQGMVLSMHQPWASLLVMGVKLHEGMCHPITKRTAEHAIYVNLYQYAIILVNGFSNQHVYPILDNILPNIKTTTGCFEEKNSFVYWSPKYRGLEKFLCGFPMP